MNCLGRPAAVGCLTHGLGPSDGAERAPQTIRTSTVTGRGLW